MADYVVIPRSVPSPRTTNYAAHHANSASDSPDGDPLFRGRQVYESDFDHVGKIRGGRARVARNLYTNIPGTQSIRSRFFGGVTSKLRFTPGISTVRGKQNTVSGLTAAVNIDRPPTMTVGDIATYSATENARLRTHLHAPLLGGH